MAVDKPAPVVIVSGFVRCGTSLMMAMLKAGGVPVGDAQAPAYEVRQAGLSAEAIARDMGVDAALALDLCRSLWHRDSSPAIDREWFAAMHGQAVKVVFPHLVRIPRGEHKAIWMDRGEAERAASLVHHYSIPWSHRSAYADFWGRYCRAKRDPAREALRLAGAVVLDVRYERVVAGKISCLKVCDGIADFLQLSLDRAAMAACAEWYVDRKFDRDKVDGHFRGHRIGTRMPA